MSRRGKDRPPTRAEQDTVDVLLWLDRRAAEEVSYAEIAAGVGIPVSNRLWTAVRGARRPAEVDGYRLEQFMRSNHPLRRGAWVARFHRAGHGDEFGARDALLACRKSVASLAEMKRATAFEATNPQSIDAQAFGQMAQTADGALRLISGVEGLGTKAMKDQQTINAMAAQIADLKAQVNEMTADPSVASA
ncbi:hypothetical protein QMK19_41140 [Streptomyces sp. H10-C2]|uniref:hypothetical protein n=1 Tax=unclassified Streptomyces TaxID=2593676 RepID=UPI0024B99CA1|nr:MULTISPECIES: hypothetical protein [unclassified Streptomyces]MDJ0347598.1 hypothetical protein [Streptomyces sp. PH10-H1]MDJ0375803.1 hypothetical protein [Streptomyces sp. H10-C2]